MNLRYTNTECPFNRYVLATEVTAVNTTDKVSIDTEPGERTISKSSRPQKHNGAGVGMEKEPAAELGGHHPGTSRDS